MEARGSLLQSICIHSQGRLILLESCSLCPQTPRNGMDHQLGQPLDQHHWNDRDDAHFDCCDAFVRVLAHCLLNVNLLFSLLLFFYYTEVFCVSSLLLLVAIEEFFPFCFFFFKSVSQFHFYSSFYEILCNNYIVQCFYLALFGLKMKTQRRITIFTDEKLIHSK